VELLPAPWLFSLDLLFAFLSGCLVNILITIFFTQHLKNKSLPGTKTWSDGALALGLQGSLRGCGQRSWPPAMSWFEEFGGGIEKALQNAVAKVRWSTPIE
jgi:hypothetical protein